MDWLSRSLDRAPYYLFGLAAVAQLARLIRKVSHISGKAVHTFSGVAAAL